MEAQLLGVVAAALWGLVRNVPMTAADWGSGADSAVDATGAARLTAPGGNQAGQSDHRLEFAAAEFAGMRLIGAKAFEQNHHFTGETRGLVAFFSAFPPRLC